MLSLRALILATFLIAANCDLQLKLLHVLFRHGDKVPHREYQNYPTDPYRNHSYYPIDNGGLTKEGMLREYKIGTMLRDRYNQYLGPIYRPSMMYARSTEVPRTQMSLQLVLAGLFPPSDAQIWNDRVPWLPTSTFSVPIEEDYLLFPHYCPRYLKELNRQLEEYDIKEIVSKYKPTLDYLTRHTGKPVNTTAAVYYLYNLLKEEAAQNLTLPEWSQSVYPNPMKEITALDFHLRSYTEDLRRMNGGMLLRKITDDMKALKEKSLQPTERKAFLFSAHELNVVALARALGTNDPVVPLYGSTIILETLYDNNNRYFVRVLLWTGVSERLIMQRIPGCDEICPLKNFLEILKEVIANDEDYRCTPVENQSDKRRQVSHAERSSATSSITASGNVARFVICHLTIFVALISRFNSFC